jgi:hypothetical protein
MGEAWALFCRKLVEAQEARDQQDVKQNNGGGRLITQRCGCEQLVQWNLEDHMDTRKEGSKKHLRDRSSTQCSPSLAK